MLELRAVAFHTTHRDGSLDDNPPLEALEALVRELDGPEDPEHPDVSVTHESEWSLSAFPSGLVIWGNFEESDERRVEGVSRKHVVALFKEVAAGDLANVDATLDRIASSAPEQT